MRDCRKVMRVWCVKCCAFTLRRKDERCPACGERKRPGYHPVPIEHLPKKKGESS